MATFTVGANYNTSNGYMGSTGYINRYHDCFIIGASLTNVLPSYATTAKDKIFTPTIYRPSGDVSNDIIAVHIEQDSRNKRTVAQLATIGATLFVKIGKDGNDAAVGSLRESGTITSVTTSKQFLGNFKEGDALCVGFRSRTQTAPASGGGLTGQYIYYITNGSTGSPSFDQIIWRVQFSFGGTVGNNYTGVPVVYSQPAAWLDTKTGSTFFRNNDRYGIDYDTVRSPNDYDPKPYNVDIV